MMEISGNKPDLENSSSSNVVVGPLVSSGSNAKKYYFWAFLL